MSKNLLKILLIIATVALYMLVIKPLYSGLGGIWQPAESVQWLMERNDQYSGTIEQAEKLALDAEKLKQEYQKISPEEKEKMEKMVPTSIDKIKLLSEVNNMIIKSGFAPMELAYSDGNNLIAGRGSAIISFSVKTTYPKFKELMDNFEKSLRLYSVQSVSFSAPETESDPTSYQVRLETYYIK